MVEIYPVINVPSFEEVKKLLKLIEGHVERVHIDVTDGSFTKTVSWHTPQDLKNLVTPLKIEVHFMVERPEVKILPWLLPHVFRVIFHEEATRHSGEVIDLCHAHGVQAGIAICPDTPWERLKPFRARADIYQLLAVSPGPSGQQFNEKILEKIKCVHSFDATTPIEIDGGVKIGVAGRCVAAGASILVGASSLIRSDLSLPQALKMIRDDAVSS